MIQLSEVSHRFVVHGRRERTITAALQDVTLTVPSGQFLAIVGPSGSGKSTLLRVVAGLTSPETGRVLVDGRPVSIPGPDRAMVFQNAALYPWRTVAANIRLALELAGDRHDPDTVVASRLAEVGLGEFAAHYPHQLSGGMQQRVALARALAVRPDTLLMDEPFGSLDAITRRRLAAELAERWQREPRTVLFVTHSIDEALWLADRVVLIAAGTVRHDVAVDLPRPRDPDCLPDDARYRELRRELWELL